MGLSPRLLRPSASGFTPRSISGLALWLDASSADTLYTTDAGPVTAVSSPLDIAGCVLWLDGADSSSTGMTRDGTLVETWKDKSNSGNNVTASGGLRPTLTSNALNSRSVLTFGGSQGLTGNLAASITTNAYSVFVVCRISGSVTNGRLLSTAGAGNDFASGSVIPCVSNGGTLSAYAGTQGTTPSGVTGFASYGVFAGVLSSNLVTNSAGGMSAASAAATLSTAVTRLGVGVAAQGGTGFNTCDIAEIILYPTALSTAQRASVEAYLAAKWGVAGVHVPATATSDPVGAWLDKSGNARHATQSVSGNRPTISAMGSRRALRLGASGAVSRLSLGNLSAAFPAAGNVFVAFQPNSDSQYTLYSTRNNDDTYANTSTSLWGTWVNTRTSVTSSRPSSGAHVANLYGTSGSFSVIEDGALIHSSSALTWEPGNDHNIGSRSASAGGQTPLDGWIGEVIAYNRALTTAERQRLERYLAARWGIALAPQVSNADAQDWINRVYTNGGTVSASTAAAVNQFCLDIENAPGGSIRDRFYRLNLFCGSNLNAALVPLYRSSAFGGSPLGNTTDTNNAFVGVGTDYADTGVTGGLTGNGSTKYLNTGFNVDQLPGAANCHLSSFITGTQDIASARTLVGTLFNGVSDRYRLFLQLVGSSAPNYGIQTELGAANSAIANNRTNTNGGLILASRTSTTLLTLYDDAVSIGTNETSTAETTGASPFFVFARNGPTEYYNGRMAAYSIGAGMTAAQVTAYNTAIQAFQAAMGRV